ncbi:hypothetical protein [Halorubrum vacuolatum]|uniref:hypothetical protein n=1 Tax=Halorubrum vacuolatum TaxID=63740 RepID=UPI0015C66AD7|nr:hypothetical protein [Halorubrum vacuolatum]
MEELTEDQRKTLTGVVLLIIGLIGVILRTTTLEIDVFLLSSVAAILVGVYLLTGRL